MKAGIYPTYEAIRAACSYGNVIKTCSALCKSIHLDVCSECHPSYTDRQKVLDTGDRIDRFKRRFGIFGVTKQATCREHAQCYLSLYRERRP